MGKEFFFDITQSKQRDIS